ncbi:hypothetical protein [Dongshaea marina]|uniref:hypothetical protein n=1 Tax=Dongshaea marina TaxID=2047966 RepID=UPI00131ED671|nr:hypothetical protein [Dongshaea marina]
MVPCGRSGEIPIAGEVDKSINLELLSKVAHQTPDDSRGFCEYIRELILDNPDAIDMLRTLIGVSDKRMYLELSYAYSKTRFNKKDKNNILGYSIYDLNKKTLKFFKNTLSSEDVELSRVSSRLISNYLVDQGLYKILRAIKKIDMDELEVLVDNLILTKEVQQAEAKRRGHGAEHALAELIHKLGLEMVPEERHAKPIGFRDPNVSRENFELSKKIKNKTWSFDLIVRSPERKNHIFVQSLIHTSDPGQYGVNKSDETILVKSDMDALNNNLSSSKELWGIVDGVGFCENKKDTIDKMLGVFDCFIQMKTLYKAGLKLHQIGFVNIKAIAFDTSFYDDDEMNMMYHKYCSPNIENVTHSEANSSWCAVEAGKATLFF